MSKNLKIIGALGFVLAFLIFAIWGISYVFGSISAHLSAHPILKCLLPVVLFVIVPTTATVTFIYSLKYLIDEIRIDQLLSFIKRSRKSRHTRISTEEFWRLREEERINKIQINDLRKLLLEETKNREAKEKELEELKSKIQYKKPTSVYERLEI